MKTVLDPTFAYDAIRTVVSEVDPGTSINSLERLDKIVSASVGAPRLRALLVGALAGLAATLATVGIFGVLAYAVAQRTNEIGIRMALGAASTDVVRSVVDRGLKLAGSGVAIGVAVSLVATRALESFLFEVDAVDPATLIVVTILLTAAALAASYIPARRAARVDPMGALGAE